MEELLNKVEKVNTTLEAALNNTNSLLVDINNTAFNTKALTENMSNDTKSALERLINNSTQSLAFSKEVKNNANNTLNVLKTIKANADMNAKVERNNTKVLNKLLSNSINMSNSIRTTLAYPLKSLNYSVMNLSTSVNNAFKSLKSAIDAGYNSIKSTLKAPFSKFSKDLQNISLLNDGLVGSIKKTLFATAKLGASLILTPLKIGFNAISHFFNNTLIGKLTAFGLLAFGLYKFVTGTKLGSTLYKAFANSEFGKSIINTVKAISGIVITLQFLPSLIQMLLNYLSYRRLTNAFDDVDIGRRGRGRRGRIGKAISKGAKSLGRGAASLGKSALPVITKNLPKVAKLAPKLLKGGVAGAVADIAGGIVLDKALEKNIISKNTHNVGSKALSGAALGATIGSFIPGIGTAIGAAIGGLGGAAVGLIQNQINKEKTEISKLDNMHKNAQISTNATISTVHNANATGHTEQVQIAKVSSKDAITTKLSLSTKEYEKAQHADAVKQQAELEKANKLNKEMVDTMRDLSIQLARNNNYSYPKTAQINSVAMG